MPTLVGQSDWTPQQVKQSFSDVIANRLDHITRYHLGDNFDDGLDSYNWYLDNSHPNNHPGAKLSRVP